jgi:hypothetical protein
MPAEEMARVVIAIDTTNWRLSHTAAAAAVGDVECAQVPVKKMPLLPAAFLLLACA